MKILLFGHKGQVGQALTRALPPTYQLAVTDIDITNDDQLREIIIHNSPDIIINAAAYTNVDGAEDNIDLAFKTNAHAPRVMAEVAKQKDILLIHYSTDYVFDGAGDTPWLETDTPAPLNQYGRSKLEGEEYVTQSGCRHFIFRTSWVYGIGGQNFIQKILQLLNERDEIKIVSDQIGAPTSARFIAEATYHAIQQQGKNGLYHLCCAGETSWYDYARLIMATHIPTSTCRITPILSENYPQKAVRPLNSRLNCSRFLTHFDFPIPSWNQEYLKNTV